MCFACRDRSHKRDMIRLVRDLDGALRPDLHATKAGRGLYVHAEEACLHILKRRTSKMRRSFDLQNLYRRMNAQLASDVRHAKQHQWLSLDGAVVTSNRTTSRIQQTGTWLRQLGQCKHTLVTVRNDSA